MRQGFAHLHDANNGCVDLVLAILEHPLLSGVLLFFRLLHLHLIDLHSEEHIAELRIPLEGVPIFDISTARILLQDLI